MVATKKAAASTLHVEPGGIPWVRALAWLHPGLLVGVSLVLAGAVFLTGAELRVLVASEAALFKLLAGAALIFLLGVFFAQAFIIRQGRAQIRSELRHGSEELDAIRQSLQDHIDKDAAKSR